MGSDALSDTDGRVRLKGRVALVTGGGRGLGRAFALALAAEGAAVAVTARTEGDLAETVRLVERQGGTAIAVPGDVTDAPAAEAVVRAVEARLGSVDVLVNNAGRFRSLGVMWEADPDDWWRDIEVNVRGPFLFIRAVVPGMVARGRGHVLNVSSGAGLGTPAGYSAYGISKTAVTRLSDAQEVERDQLYTLRLRR
jgi:NAD(P)-dependent dehydrogenase (short-subunit alcohol dehydrogenase family)